ncbi:hypothetical protein [Conexibacter woesei]|uniref:Uncharacterized protein n=1 Tax=Conexibacter woesei (strain DSM 14684 / CCUG 47730 / CIP 108061 / JCM 11494 / NBRC 100937 / ID131577) TaxID=469383 RepID=D3EZ95_CONWI|nr:hypothetical protein [Conexibacter woesei]ADB51860.1 hypothetical protein Cwoe_3442 [Conexibacter woesei DSM 14684]
MPQLWRTAAGAVVGVIATALVVALLPGAAVAAPRRPRDRTCGTLARPRIVDIVAEGVTCRVALEIVGKHARSAARRGACDPARTPASCRLRPFECVAKTFDDIGTRVICFTTADDRKVTFRYPR